MSWGSASWGEVAWGESGPLPQLPFSAQLPSLKIAWSLGANPRGRMPVAFFARPRALGIMPWESRANANRLLPSMRIEILSSQTNISQIEFESQGPLITIMANGTLPVAWDSTLSPAILGILPIEILATIIRGKIFLQRRTPNTVIASNNLRDSLGASPPVTLTDINEPVAEDDGEWWEPVTRALAAEARLSFPMPTIQPSGGQDFRLLLRKTPGSPTPTVTIELWENGAFRATLLVNVPITSEVGEIVTATWNANWLLDPSGAGVEIRILTAPGLS